jgi:hypothetical protein
MDRLAVTRFNDQTWKENVMYRNSRQNSGCIYNSPRRISPLIYPDTVIFVIEMNNSLNQIEGIGLIKNHLVLDKKYNIYSDKNYNRYTFKSKYRIDRKEILNSDKILIELLEMLLFLGSTHMKRGQGIQEVPDWIKKNKKLDFIKSIKQLFINKYTEINNN